MKTRNNYCGAALAVMLLSSTLSSCTSGPDLKQGLKVTITTNNEESIRSLAGNTDDPAFNQVLDSVAAQARSNMQLVNDFISVYKTRQPNKPLSGFFNSGDAQDFVSDEALRGYLIAAVNNASKKMDQVLKARVHAFAGTPEALIRIEHPTDNQTLLYIPGLNDKKALEPVFNNRGGLHFWETYNLEEMGAYLAKLDETLKEEQHSKQQPAAKSEVSKEVSLQEMVDKSKQEQAANSSRLFSLIQPMIDQQGRPYGGAMIAIANPKDTARASRLLQSETAKALMPANVRWVWGSFPGKDQKVVVLYAIRIPPGGKATVDNDDIASARGLYEDGRAEISIKMTPAGATKWSRMTRLNTGKAIAIELNHYIYSAPNVNGTITGGASSITGNFSEKEMDELVKVLNSGSFPLSFTITHTEAHKNP